MYSYLSPGWDGGERLQAGSQVCRPDAGENRGCQWICQA